MPGMPVKTEEIKKNNSKEGRKKQIISPQQLSAASGDRSGEIDLVWEPVEGAGTYIIQKSSGRNMWIQEDILSRTNCTISRLKSGRKYWFRVAAVNVKGQGPWSEPVQKKVP
jgi:hypothetical protein